MLGFDNYLSKMLAAAVKTGPKEKNYRCRIKLQWVPSHFEIWSPSGLLQDIGPEFFFFCNIQGRKNEIKKETLIMVQLDLIGSNFVSILTNGFIQTVASPALYWNKPNAFIYFP